MAAKTEILRKFSHTSTKQDNPKRLYVPILNWASIELTKHKLKWIIIIVSICRALYWMFIFGYAVSVLSLNIVNEGEQSFVIYLLVLASISVPSEVIGFAGVIREQIGALKYYLFYVVIRCSSDMFEYVIFLDIIHSASPTPRNLFSEFLYTILYTIVVFKFVLHLEAET